MFAKASLPTYKSRLKPDKWATGKKYPCFTYSILLFIVWVNNDPTRSIHVKRRRGWRLLLQTDYVMESGENKYIKNYSWVLKHLSFEISDGTPIQWNLNVVHNVKYYVNNHLTSGRKYIYSSTVLLQFWGTAYLCCSLYFFFTTFQRRILCILLNYIYLI